MKKVLKDILHILILLKESWETVFTQKIAFKEVQKYFLETGFQSLPIVCLSTAFAGIVVTDEMAWHMKKALSNTQMIPGFSGQFIFRELGIVIPALLIVSKVGASTAAEISNMKISEQLDALKILKINPIRYLVTPRMLGSMAGSVCLMFIACSISLVSAMGVASFKYHFSLLEYLNGVQDFLKLSDILTSLLKAALFGMMIPLISCSYGFRSQEGAQGVGFATTHSVVAGTIAVIFLDFLVTYLFTRPL